VHQQKLVAAISIAIISLLTRLESATLEVAKYYVHLIVVKFRFIPTELFIRLV
jgi:hypothetical protein